MESCDRCGPNVRAFVFADLNGLELAYCGHCGERFIPGLVAAGALVVDLRYMIGHT